MSRPIRIEFPGAIYHITSRGHDERVIFHDDEDREFFLDTLTDVAERYHWICHAYCLMDNHYHLVIETLEGNLSIGMRQLNGVYTQRFNHSYNLTGPVMHGRFKAVLAQRETYLLALCRYVVLNPVRLGEVDDPKKYPWSSYCISAGLAEPSTLISSDWLLSQFGKQIKRSLKLYREFVQEGIGEPSPLENTKRQILLGDDAFVEQMSALLDPATARKLAKEKIRQLRRPKLERMFANAEDKISRNEAIRTAHKKYQYSLTEIANFIGLHCSTVSKIANQEFEEE